MVLDSLPRLEGEEAQRRKKRKCVGQTRRRKRRRQRRKIFKKGKYLVCEEEENREGKEGKEGKYLEKESLFLCGGEEKRRMKRKKICQREKCHDGRTDRR